MAYFDELNDHTRATYYVLPLLGLNKYSFGMENFVNARVSTDLTTIVVQVKSTEPSVAGLLGISHTDYLYHNATEYHFRIPRFYVSRGDIQKFKEGKYSELSEGAQAMIKAYSGLSYQKPYTKEDGKKGFKTDSRLIALRKADELRWELEELLNVSIDPDSELISPPKDDEFVLLSTVVY